MLCGSRSCIRANADNEHPPIPNPPPRARAALRRLGYNDISADGASALASVLYAGSSKLESLELQGNSVGDAGAIAFADGLVGGDSNFKNGGSGGGRGSRGRHSGDERGRRRRGLRAQQEQRRGGSGLRRLNLAGNGIGCLGGCALAKAVLGGEVKLEELDLAGNAVSGSERDNQNAAILGPRREG